MKPIKGGLADLKRLQQQAQERQVQQKQQESRQARERQRDQPAPRAVPASGPATRAAAAAQAARTEDRRPREFDTEDDAELLRRSLAGVTRISQGSNINTRVFHAAPSHEQLLRRQSATGADNLAAAHNPTPQVSDEYIAARLIEDGTAYLRAGVAPDTVKRLRRGKWPFRTEIDLHGMTIDAARQALIPFLAQCRQQGHKGVRVIHGKGLGSPDQQSVLREKVKTWLVQYTGVLAFAQGREADGGAGAVLVLLADAED